LLSINAIGTVGKELIYRRRKKVDDVKRYIKTVNPDLPGQKIQKGYFREAINEWKTARYSSFDVQAWNLYARSKKVIASGFNRFTGLKIKADKEGKTWNKLTNCNIYDVTGAGFKVDIDVESDLSGVLYLGISKFSMLKEFVGTFAVNKYTFTIIGLSESTKYYFYIKNTSEGEQARTGIYCQKTGVGVPIVIDIGVEPIGRETGYVNYTLINKANPANATGKITSIEIWVTNTAYITFCIFKEVSANRFTTGDWVKKFPIEPGAKRTFEVNLNVEIGDYIGCTNFLGAGIAGVETTGGEGVWFKAGNYIPCENIYFNLSAAWVMDLYGTGEE